MQFFSTIKSGAKIYFKVTKPILTIILILMTVTGISIPIMVKTYKWFLFSYIITIVFLVIIACYVIYKAPLELENFSPITIKKDIIKKVIYFNEDKELSEKTTIRWEFRVNTNRQLHKFFFKFSMIEDMHHKINSDKMKVTDGSNNKIYTTFISDSTTTFCYAFDNPLSRGQSYNLSFEYILENSLFKSLDEIKRYQGDKIATTRSYNLHSFVIKYLTEVMIREICFPTELKIEKDSLEIFETDDSEKIPIETRTDVQKEDVDHSKKSMARLELSNGYVCAIYLKVVAPQFGVRYQVRWVPPEKNINV